MTLGARDAVLYHFQWRHGHADVWRVFSDGDALSTVVRQLADPWRTEGVTKIAGVESRGFLLGAAVALELGVGFVAIRKADGLLPGATLAVDAAPDYRNTVHRLRIQSVLTEADRVLLVDDWAERGSQALAGRQLIESAGAAYVGLSVSVDQLEDAARDMLHATSILRAEDLPPVM